MAKGNSSGGLYRKSTRRATLFGVSRVITKHLLAPHDNVTKIMFSSNSASVNFLKSVLSLDVIITSISPDSCNPRR